LFFVLKFFLIRKLDLDITLICKGYRSKNIMKRIFWYHMFRWFCMPGVLLLMLLAGPEVSPDSVFAMTSEVKPVVMLTKDDQGAPLRTPSAVFFDKTTEETYVVNSGASRIIVYGSDFFPCVSLGAGRSVYAPYGGTVDSDGRLYVCQGRSQDKPACVTILNAAFFPIKEIRLEGFEGADNFIPRRVALGHDGRIYLAGINSHGVLVLDKDGNYLRWLTPLDRIWTGMEESEAGPDTVTKPGRGKEPVLILEVCTDSEGRIYLLSEETSKIYVYDRDENFLFAFGKKGGYTGKMSRPRGLAVDEGRNRIYVVDYLRHTILVYDLTGRHLFEFDLIVADFFNNRIQVLEVSSRPELLPEDSNATIQNFPTLRPKEKSRRR
jgi:DNA-binding beta-propeller fold protein YncE